MGVGQEGTGRYSTCIAHGLAWVPLAALWGACWCLCWGALCCWDCAAREPPSSPPLLHFPSSPTGPFRIFRHLPTPGPRLLRRRGARPHRPGVVLPAAQRGVQPGGVPGGQEGPRRNGRAAGMHSTGPTGLAWCTARRHVPVHLLKCPKLCPPRARPPSCLLTRQTPGLGQTPTPARPSPQPPTHSHLYPRFHLRLHQRTTTGRPGRARADGSARQALAAGDPLVHPLPVGGGYAAGGRQRGGGRVGSNLLQVWRAKAAHEGGAHN